MSLGRSGVRQKLVATFFITASISLSFLLIFGTRHHILSWETPRVEGELLGQVLSTPVIPTQTPQRTQEIAKEIAQSILKENPTGPIISEGGVSGISTINPEAIANDVLVKKIEEITRSVLEPQLNGAYIKTTDAANREANIEYLGSRAGIINQAGQAVQEHSFDFRKLTDEDLMDLIDIYEFTLEQLYALPVPKNLLDLHKEQLRLTTIERNIFTNIANYRTDALSASISISLYEKVFLQISEYRKTLREYMTVNNIKL
jgi:hypothetical protein